MKVPSQDTKEFIEYADIIDDLARNQAEDPWIVCEMFINQEDEATGETIQHAGLFSYFVPGHRTAEELLSSSDRDLDPFEARPQHVGFGKDTVFCRFGNRLNLTPLVIRRHFHGLKGNYVELLEEFRLYHNLFQKSVADPLVRIFDDGGEEIVAMPTKIGFKVRQKELFDFMNVSNQSLVMSYYFTRFATKRLEDMGAPEKQLHTRIGNVQLTYASANYDGALPKANRSYSVLYAKKILENKSSESHEKKKYVEFVIGQRNGSDVVSSANPEELNNNFDKNPGKPHYLTPVFFERKVLKKYLDEPEKYTVRDGHVDCADLWSLEIDNDRSDALVSAYLGDLGRTLSTKEQMYWRHFNVTPPSDVFLSETKIHRDFLAIPFEPSSPDLLFRREYRDLIHKWNDLRKWYLYKPLGSADKHTLEMILRVSHNNQKALDEQILYLCKLLIDSINVRELDAKIGQLIEKKSGGITKLETYFKSIGVADKVKDGILFLRRLNTLRQGAAHRRSSSQSDKEYEQTIEYYGLPSGNFEQAHEKLLSEALQAVIIMKSVLDYPNQV